MALPALATAADLDRFGYDSTVITGEFLERASARVRAYTRQIITEVLGDQVTRTAFEPVRLPERPVQQVTSVTWLDGDPIAEHTLVGSLLYLRDLNDLPLPDQHRFGVFGRYCQPVTVKVTYDHGYATDALPDELVELVCAVAARMARTPAGVEAGVRSQLVGGYQVTYSEEGARHHGDLLPGERQVLDRLFPRTRARTLRLP